MGADVVGLVVVGAAELQAERTMVTNNKTTNGTNNLFKLSSFGLSKILKNI